MSDLSKRQEVMLRLGRDRPLAHQTLFKHRHPNASPEFHRGLILDWHASDRSYLDMVFRGGAKSTIAEEAIVIKTLFREFKNCLIIGADADRAAARLHAVAHELANNEFIRKVFGDLVGETWAPNDGRIVTSSGICIQSLGRGQSLRGIKFLDARPDLLFADDLEDYADVIKPESRKKLHDWFDGELDPALEPGYMARMAATPLHPEALPYHVLKDPTWKVHKFPIKYRGEDGEWRSSWPARFPLTENEAKILRTRGWRQDPPVEVKCRSIQHIEEGLVKKGQIHLFNCEYMCEAESAETKAFKREMFRVEPQVRSWQAVFSMFDPARTVGPKSATTGKATWSWIGGKLVIWDAWARRLMPDEIITGLFEDYEAYRPVHIGFEEDGLNQWALQPIRQEMVRRGVTLPLKAMRAPPGKTEFIRGLQPFFHAREVILAKEMPDLVQQLLGFPSGEIDAPNALAYALRMKPGAPIYNDFGAKHVADHIEPSHARSVVLCLNCTRSVVTAVALQVFDGSVRIYRDYVREGSPNDVVPGLLSDCQSDIGTRDLQLIAGPVHFDRYNNMGLAQAIARIPRKVDAALPCERGRPMVSALLQREKGGMPTLMVSDKATWTLNAFAAGYSRVLLKQGQLADYAEEGPYRVLMEGLESYLALLELGSTELSGQARFNAETAEGRPYISMLGRANQTRDSKEDWGVLLKG